MLTLYQEFYFVLDQNFEINFICKYTINEKGLVFPFFMQLQYRTKKKIAIFVYQVFNLLILDSILNMISVNIVFSYFVVTFYL